MRASAARRLLLSASARLAAAAGAAAGEAGVCGAAGPDLQRLGCLAPAMLQQLAASSCNAGGTSQQQGHSISTSPAGRQLPALGASSAHPPLGLHQQQRRHLSLPAAAASVGAPHIASPFGNRPAARTPPQSSSSSVLEASIRATPDIARLAAVVAAHGAALSPREALGALQRLNKLNKLHRHRLKQEHVQQGEAASARAAARTQRRQRAAASLQAVHQRLQGGQPQEPAAQSGAGQPQQQPADHEEQLEAAAAPLMQRLTEVLPQLSAEQLVHLLSCLAQLEGGASMMQGSTRLLVGVLTELAGYLATLPGSHLSQVAAALAQLDASNLDARSADRLLQAAEDETGDTAQQPPANCSSSSTSSSAATTSSSEQQAAAEAARALLVKLCAAVQQQQPQQSSMDGAALATFVHAMARLGHNDWPTMRHVASLLLPGHVQELTPSSISKLLIGCTKLHHFDAQLCNLLAGAAEACMPQASGAEVAQIVWSLAHQRHEHPGVFEAAAQQAVARAHELGPRHVTNLAWGFAVRKAYSPALYNALAARAVELLESAQLVEADRSSVGGSSIAASDGDSSSSSTTSSSSTLVTAAGEDVLPQHLSLIAWSFAKQGHKSEGLMQLLGDKAAAGTAGEWRPQNISNLAWAFGCLGVQHAPLFAALCAAAKGSHLEHFNHQNMTDLCWGAVAAGHQDPELFELVARATAGRMPELSPHSLSDLVWVFAAARAPQAPQVLAAAAPAVLACLPRFSSGMLADLLWSYAATGVRDEALLDGVAQMLALPDRLAALEGDIDVQAKLIYAMKVLPSMQSPQLVEALGAVVPGLAVLLAAE